MCFDARVGVSCEASLNGRIIVKEDSSSNIRVLQKHQLGPRESDWDRETERDGVREGGKERGREGEAELQGEGRPAYQFTACVSAHQHNVSTSVRQWHISWNHLSLRCLLRLPILSCGLPSPWRRSASETIRRRNKYLVWMQRVEGSADLRDMSDRVCVCVCVQTLKKKKKVALHILPTVVFSWVKGVKTIQWSLFTEG